MNGQRVIINLRKENLFGFEKQKNIILIDAIIKGIEARDKIPPIYARKVNDTYVIIPGYPGGHHRAVAHYITGAPLSIIIWDEANHQPAVPIQDIKLFDHRELTPPERDYFTRKFYTQISSHPYPRLDWEGWNLAKEHKGVNVYKLWERAIERGNYA